MMKTLGLREAKASLSAVVEAAARGEATTITKHGRPAAVVVSVKERLDARELRSGRGARSGGGPW
jgi:prevent-host-death family protein